MVRRIIYKNTKDAHITHLRTSKPEEITEAQSNWTGDMVGVEGQFDYAVPKPYRISYRAIRPKKSECVNLLVPTVISSTHPAFGSSRMEPVFMILGQSAATAAVLALDEGVAVQDVPYADLSARLLADGQILDKAAGPRPVRRDPKELPGITVDRKSTRLNSSHLKLSRMPSSA